MSLSLIAGGAVIAPALASGSIDIGRSNVVSIAIAHERGFGFVYLTSGALSTEGHRVHKTMVAADSKIRNARHLIRKTAPMNTLDNIPYVAMAAWLRKNGSESQALELGRGSVSEPGGGS